MSKSCPSGRVLLSGDEAVALAAFHAGTHLGTGYPGTPSTEILEAFDARGGRAQWAPNEKVALEPALIPGQELKSAKSLNVALLGALSRHLQFSEADWVEAVLAHLDPKQHALNLQAFHIGRSV